MKFGAWSNCESKREESLLSVSYYPSGQSLACTSDNYPSSDERRRIVGNGPSPGLFSENRPTVPWLTTMKAAREIYSKGLMKATGVILVGAGLALLAGCQGVSTGNHTQASPGLLGSTPASLSFGTVTVGKAQSLSGTVTNTGGSSVSISQVGISGAGFTLSGISAPVTLTAGQSSTFSIKFAPTTPGTANGNVTVTSDASNTTLTIAVSGTGTTAVGKLAVSPTSLPLGNVVDGTSASASGNLTASGANVTITGASTTNSVFNVGGLSLPMTIPAGQSVPFTITFSPQVPGAASATLTVTSNAQPSTTTEALTGTGTATPTHSVNLSWNASTSSNISGYNVYRAVYSTSTTSCGSYAKINSVVNTTTLYTDSGVVNGTSYCYAATAVNTGNQESSYSNIVSNIKIPLT